MSRMRGRGPWSKELCCLMLLALLGPLGTMVAQAATLSVVMSGSGQGAVNSFPAGITCPGTCSGTFSGVSLYANPAANALFRGWGGACAGMENCTLSLNGDQTVTAFFDLKPSSVSVSGSSYGAIGMAYRTVQPGGTVMVVARDQAGDLRLDKSVAFTLKGGFDDAFSTNAGNRTKLRGNLSINAGSVRLAGIALAPSVPAPPSVPSGVTAAAGDAQVAVSWDAVSGAASYNVYYSTSTWVTRANGTKVTGAVSGQAIPGLANGTTYHFVVTAVDADGESAESAQVMNTPVQNVPSAPTGVTASAGNGKVEIGWNAVAGATSYNIYWSTAPGVTKANGTKVSAVAAPPYQHAGVANGTTYYYIVTTNIGAQESAPSAEASAKPTSAPARLVKMSMYEGQFLQQYMTYEYDAQGHKIKQSSFDFADNLEGYNTFEYNAAGKQTKVSNYLLGGELIGYTTTEYNAAGHILVVSNYTSFGGTTLKMTYTVNQYDENENVIKISNYNGFTNLVTQYTTKEYNAANNPVKISNYTSGLLTGYSTYEYDANDREVKVSTFGPTAELTKYVTTEYNAAGKQIKETTYNALTGLMTTYTTYEYNATGMLIKTSDYDFADNLTGYSTTAYDADGNITRVDDYDDTGVLNGSVTFEYSR